MCEWEKIAAASSEGQNKNGCHWNTCAWLQSPRNEGSDWNLLLWKLGDCDIVFIIHTEVCVPLSAQKVKKEKFIYPTTFLRIKI